MNGAEAEDRGAAADASQALEELHDRYLKDNEYDEGDPIFYRITYRLAEALGISNREAAEAHLAYHKAVPRRVSEGYCERCGRVVKIVPIIYGVQESELEKMRQAESEGRLIVGDVRKVRQGAEVAMFGCSVCRGDLAKYGTL